MVEPHSQSWGGGAPEWPSAARRGPRARALREDSSPHELKELPAGLPVQDLTPLPPANRAAGGHTASAAPGQVWPRSLFSVTSTFTWNRRGSWALCTQEYGSVDTGGCGSFILRLRAPVLGGKRLVPRPSRAWRDPPLTSTPRGRAEGRLLSGAGLSPAVHQPSPRALWSGERGCILGGSCGAPRRRSPKEPGLGSCPVTG